MANPIPAPPKSDAAPLPAPDAGILSLKDQAEATLVYQGAPASDPLAEAIQKEMGRELTPSPLTSPIAQSLAEGLGPVEGEVFRCMNLTKAYGEGSSYTEVIKGISFTVKKGDYIVIYGPSGSGKSTLLHMLAGLEPPTRGEIRVGSHSIHDFSDEELAIYHREEVGLVFQSFNLLDSLRVWENVAFPLMLAGAPLDWRRREALKMLERFGLLDFANHYPTQLSGGQQQRVALARALIHDPDLLLIDEPTGNLDSKSAKTVIEEIARLHSQENRTIILVTHSQEFLQYATRIFYIRDGTLLTSKQQEGPAGQDMPPLVTPGERSGLEAVTLQPLATAGTPVEPTSQPEVPEMPPALPVDPPTKPRPQPTQVIQESGLSSEVASLFPSLQEAADKEAKEGGGHG